MNHLKRLQFTVFLAIAAATAVVCWLFILHSFANQQDKIDRAALNHVRYGLFSVDAWKEQLQTILSEEIDSFHLTRTTKQELRKRIEESLDTLIHRAYERVRQENDGSVTGWLRRKLIDELVDLEHIRQGIPQSLSALHPHDPGFFPAPCRPAFGKRRRPGALTILRVILLNCSHIVRCDACPAYSARLQRSVSPKSLFWTFTATWSKVFNQLQGFGREGELLKNYLEKPKDYEQKKQAHDQKYAF